MRNSSKPQPETLLGRFGECDFGFLRRVTCRIRSHNWHRRSASVRNMGCEELMVLEAAQPTSEGWQSSQLDFNLRDSVAFHRAGKIGRTIRQQASERDSLMCSLLDQAARFLRRGLRLLTFVTILSMAGPLRSTTICAGPANTFSAGLPGANSWAM